MGEFTEIKSPLTVVGIFAGTTEAVGSIALPFILPDNQEVFMWFLMIFPILLVLLFFIILWFKPEVWYAPKDFRDDQNWLKANKIPLSALIIKETEPEESSGDLLSLPRMGDSKNAVIKTLGGKYTWRTIRGIARELGFSKEHVQTEMDWLFSQNLVFKSAKKERWALTKKGRLDFP